MAKHGGNHYGFTPRLVMAGRPYPLETMLRIHLISIGTRSDGAMEDAL